VEATAASTLEMFLGAVSVDVERVQRRSASTPARRSPRSLTLVCNLAGLIGNAAVASG